MVWNERCHYDKRTYVCVCVSVCVLESLSLRPHPSPIAYYHLCLDLSCHLHYHYHRDDYFPSLPKKKMCSSCTQHSCPGERWTQKSGVGGNPSSKSYYIWQLRKKMSDKRYGMNFNASIISSTVRNQVRWQDLWSNSPTSPTGPRS